MDHKGFKLRPPAALAALLFTGVGVIGLPGPRWVQLIGWLTVLALLWFAVLFAKRAHPAPAEDAVDSESPSG